MPVGLTGLPELLPVPGVRLGVAQAGIRKPNRHDLVVVELGVDTACAAVFTRNAFCAAPVVLAKNHLQQTSPRYLLINTGYANAGTGASGMQDAKACCAALAELTGVQPAQVLPFSTGVIGERLPVDKLVAGLPQAIASLAATAWPQAAQGIMTTDIVAKGASRQVQFAEGHYTVTGIAKGSGMIHPHMATMLAFVATDAAVHPDLLQTCLNQAVASSFNCISVDGDTSTNDACLLLATGASGGSPITHHSDPRYPGLAQAITEVCTALAQAIVRDGEGATKFITLDVRQGLTQDECKQVAYAIARSPLVKTAFFASDPNWGRILAAIGYAGVPAFDIEAVQIMLNGVCIVQNGSRAPDYREELGREVMRQDEITVQVLLGRGSAQVRVWTCDFSYDYVKINAEYRS